MGRIGTLPLTADKVMRLDLRVNLIEFSVIIEESKKI